MNIDILIDILKRLQEINKANNFIINIITNLISDRIRGFLKWIFIIIGTILLISGVSIFLVLITNNFLIYNWKEFNFNKIGISNLLSSLKISNLEIADGDWVSFSGGYVGAIIGGILSGLFTYAGVQVGINHEKRKLKEDEIDKYKPFIQMRIIKGKLVYEGIECTVNKLELKNIGNGPALNINSNLEDKIKDFMLFESLNFGWGNFLSKDESIEYLLDYLNQGTMYNWNTKEFFMYYQDINGIAYKQRYELIRLEMKDRQIGYNIKVSRPTKSNIVIESYYNITNESNKS